MSSIAAGLHPGLGFLPLKLRRSWTLADLDNLVVWINQDSYSQDLSRWSDISGNGLHLTAPGGASFPSQSAGAVNFDGNSDTITTGDISVATDVTAPISYFILLRVNSYDASEQAGLNNIVDGFNADRALLRRADAATTNIFWGSFAPSPGLANNETALISIDFSQGPTGTVHYKNGVAGIPGDSGAITNPGGFFLGARANLTRFCAMSVYSFAVIKGVLSEENRQRVEGFMAHESGLTSLLPALHPYKNSPPTV